MITNDVSDYFGLRDAAADPVAFPHFLIGALSVLVAPEVWELALEAAQDTDRREAAKAAAS